jgi:hypothetical protein
LPALSQLIRVNACNHKHFDLSAIQALVQWGYSVAHDAGLSG